MGVFFYATQPATHFDSLNLTAQYSRKDGASFSLSSPKFFNQRFFIVSAISIISSTTPAEKFLRNISLKFLKSIALIQQLADS